MPPPRYFAGRPPAPAFESSSEDDAPAPANRAAGAGLRKRPRFVARVVSQPEPEKPQSPEIRKRPRTSTFVPVDTSKRNAIEKDESQSDDGDSLSSSSGGSESGTDSEGSQQDGHNEEEEEEEVNMMPRPVFIARHRRTKPQVDEDEKVRIAEEQAAAEKAARRREAQDLVAHILDEEENQDDVWGGDGDLPDDDDEEDREAEYALWKVRELLRIKRDRDEALEWKRKRSGEAIEPRKEQAEESDHVTDDDKEKEETKQKPAFLQKFYKMGPFFLETEEDGRYKEEIYNRDYHEGTLEDEIQKQSLPAPLQVRRGDFGRAGRSKYSHLAAEDTAAGLARELRQDKELAAVLPQNGSRKT